MVHICVTTCMCVIGEDEWNYFPRCHCSSNSIYVAPSVTEFCTLFQFPYPWTPSHSSNLPPWTHLYVCHLCQTVWCQLPTSPALWPMRAPSSGSGPSHLGSPSPRCGSLMGQGPALCRYPRSLLPMQGTTHAQPASMDSLLLTSLLFNSMVSATHHYRGGLQGRHALHFTSLVPRLSPVPRCRGEPGNEASTEM